MLWLTASMALASQVAIAHAHPICGDPPPVADESLKADVAGKAQLLSRFIGDASLTGQIETQRTDIFSRYRNTSERSDAYFEYEMCVLLMDDQSLSGAEKRSELIRIRQSFAQPVQTQPVEGDASDTQMECEDAAAVLKHPLMIRAGMCFTDPSGQRVATLSRVDPSVVVFVSAAGEKVSCYPGDTCSFGFQNVPSFSPVAIRSDVYLEPKQ